MPLVAVLVLALQAGGAESATLHRRGSPPLCAVIRVSSPSLSLTPRDHVFSSREILDLRFEARLRSAPKGDHRLRLRILTPGGFLYQAVTVPFVGGGDRAAAARLVPGYPRPVPVQRLVPVADESAGPTYALSTVMPVAGTSITQSSLYGRWTVESYLDDETEACGPAARFTIRD